MAAALGIAKSQVHRAAQAGMPMHSVDAAQAWRLASLDLSRTADTRIDRPRTPSPSPDPGHAADLTQADRDTEDAASAATSDASADAHTAAYRADRARNERIKADRAELELAQLRGDLVHVRDVEEMEFTAGRITRDRVLMVPARLAADLHAVALSLVPEDQREAFATTLSTHALERRLDTELRAALSDAAKAIEDARRDDDDPA